MIGRRVRCLHLRNDKVFDAELFALFQASIALDNRNETGQYYTTLSDSTAAITRAQPGDAGAG